MNLKTMERLPLSLLGARINSKNPFLIEFGLFIPEISGPEGYQVFVKVIHEHDQFLQEIQPHKFELNYQPFDQSNYVNCLDYWSAKVNLKDCDKFHSNSSWGKKGKYLYRYCLKHPDRDEIDWIIDPFAREFGMAKLSAFTIGEKDYEWSKNEQKEWKTPALNDLMIYEMMISEFGIDLKTTINRLDYLADLGINCIKIMPISNVVNTIDWGYKPIGYFGVDDRFGKSKHFKKLIDEAHQRGIAVIQDVVYAHTEEHFAYSYLYRKLGKPNPVMGKFGKDGFGPDDECTNFNHPFIRDFFFTVNCYLLEEYHLDGFRYDYVPGYWDGPEGKGYANLTYNTYQEVKSKAKIVENKEKNWQDWQRFFSGDTINLIQCAEQLENPEGILHESYSNCTWQNHTLYISKRVTEGNFNFLDNLALSYSLYRYPHQVSQNGDTQTKTALQYIETHDHSRFLCNWGCKPSRNEHLLREGHRENWYKVQPYLIGTLTAKGIPLIWQGQEFAENYHIPPEGAIRVMLFRPVRWEYFYDEIGQKMIRLVRKLIQIRRDQDQPQFRSLNDESFYFHNHHDHYQSRGILMLSRKHENHASLIALNFSDQDHTVKFQFSPEHFPIPENGKVSFQEQLHGEKDLKDISVGEEYDLTIPSNYGRIWTLI
ncbi:alpha-amylase family glycosyl hydrolase [Capilliphycus salinus ALCB114379]|uniref:alpha-amylase family glycosyl hydrolase n=1 Tax=Capilliphycus salinus TaxID=2768948 RepID=UPI0039A41866